MDWPTVQSSPERFGLLGMHVRNQRICKREDEAGTHKELFTRE